MNSREFQALAYAGSAKYYEYLSERKKSRKFINVRKIVYEASAFYLTLEDSLTYPDYVGISDKRFVDTEPIVEVLGWNEEKRTLCVRLRPGDAAILQTAEPDELKVYSDLRFLVYRVKEWYRNYGGALELPKAPPKVKPRDKLLIGAEPDASQRQAIKDIMLSPLRYIWGAPGTGKTRYVLAECILEYIAANRPVLIVAPTNNAIEQTLYGVLASMVQAGLEDQIPQLVFRKGIPSKEFAKAWPDVCEIDRSKYYSSQIALFAEYIYLRQKEEVSALALKIMSARSEEKRLENEIPSLKKQQEELHKRAQESLKLYDELEKRRAAIPAEIAPLDRKLKRFFISKKKKEALLKMKYSLIDEEAAAQKKMSGLLNEAKSHNDATDSLSLQMQEAQKQYNRLKKQLSKLSPQKAELDKKLDEIKAFCLESFSPAEADVDSLRYSRLRGLSTDKLYARLEELKQQARSSEELNSQRLSKSLVVATTIDTYISKLGAEAPEFRPQHVFIDEAAYCPLVKAATLLYYRCPLTLLGDHMQLPPVCEIGEKDVDHDTFIWDQSALYLQEAFSVSTEELFSVYKDNKAVPAMPTSFLSVSFRYGNELANMLSELVYADSSEPLSGRKDACTQIYYVDAPDQGDSATRVNQAEIEALGRVIPDVGKDYAVLVPYNKQLEALLKRYPKLKTDAFTIHRSQGREWDTVIISVVDTTRKFLMNSKNPVSNGKKVINTAISRAKRRIILVCDYNYWLARPEQLLGQLLGSAEKWPS